MQTIYAIPGECSEVMTRCDMFNWSPLTSSSSQQTIFLTKYAGFELVIISVLLAQLTLKSRITGSDENFQMINFLTGLTGNAILQPCRNWVKYFLPLVAIYKRR
jgi:hypothetical protein